jgi:hypothetical protein
MSSNVRPLSRLDSGTEGVEAAALVVPASVFTPEEATWHQNVKDHPYIRS